MKVIALSLGFYRGARKRIGDVFDMDESAMKKKDGKPTLPSWVKPVSNEREAKQEAEAVKKAEQDRMIEGAKTASGGKAAREKAERLAAEASGRPV